MMRKVKPYGLNKIELGKILKEKMPEYNFVYERAVPGASLIGARPDYRCDTLSLIIEMHGFHHYCSPQQIYGDDKKDKDWHIALGYRIVRIPYFVQMCDGLISMVTKGHVKTYRQKWLHGFIGDKVLLPANFCERGVQRFKQDLEIYSFAKEEIIQSLKEKVNKKGHISLVLPPSLYYLLDEK